MTAVMMTVLRQTAPIVIVVCADMIRSLTVKQLTFAVVTISLCPVVFLSVCLSAG